MIAFNVIKQGNTKSKRVACKTTTERRLWQYEDSSISFGSCFNEPMREFIFE
jgi:hypothetical protein